jgi:hydrogenase maturation protease
MEKTLLLGYGNPDRGDDGVAWHILQTLFKEKGVLEADLFCCDFIPLDEQTDVWFNFQLLPEIAEIIKNYKRAIFLDAHTGEIKENIRLAEVKPVYSNSPFTHHMTPSALLALTESISGSYPESWLLSIRGYQFEFNQELSVKTKELATQAIQMLITNLLS